RRAGTARRAHGDRRGRGARGARIHPRGRGHARPDGVSRSAGEALRRSALDPDRRADRGRARPDLPRGVEFPDGGRAGGGRGRAAAAVVEEFLADPFIARRPPKSAGREEFGASYLKRFLARTTELGLADRLRTAVEITAGAVARGVAQSGSRRPDEVLVSGGG